MRSKRKGIETVSTRPPDRSPSIRLRSIIEHLPDGIVIVSSDGLVRFANPAAETLFGRPATELVGASFGYPAIVGETTEIDLVRRGGETVTAELRAVDTEWEGEQVSLVSLRDITDRKRSEEQARELAREQAARAEAQAAQHQYRVLAEEKANLASENARLYERSQEANRTKAEFLAVMSHELRTPLNAITGYAQLLETGVTGTINEKQRQQLQRIQARSRHLLELVDDILTFSRLEAGRDAIHAEAVDFAQLLDEVVALARPLAEEKKLGLTVDCRPKPCEGKADADKVRQILLNLLSNAIKFTERGEVCVEAEADGGEIVFRVRDTGVGIPHEQLDQIWAPFWQVEQSWTRSKDGVGLGLSVVRRLTDLMDGKVDVRSTRGAGSTFTVRLPMQAVSRPEREEVG
jgi:signal transduction histidine kinase